MAGVDAFIDSNVVLYLLSGDAARADRAEALLGARPLISVQVLNEVTHVCARKLHMAWSDVDAYLSVVKVLCQVVPLTVETHDMGRKLAQRYAFSFYDACIVAAALLAGCHTLYTEDMHHGLVVDGGLVLKNPFL